MKKPGNKTLTTIGMVAALAVWRIWPLALIFTGSNLRVSSDFQQLGSLLPTEQEVRHIYPGLSHPFWSGRELTKEIIFGSRKIIHGHGFRTEPSHEENLKKIALILMQPSTYFPWAGEKLCGGFHADYCFTWEEETGTCHILLCMGCHEAILYRNGKSLRCDLNSQTAEKIMNLLKELDHETRATVQIPATEIRTW